MNGRDEFQTGVGADAPTPEAGDGTAAGPATPPAAVHDAPESGATASGVSSIGSSTNTNPPPLKSSRSNGLWGYQVPDSVQNALTPLEPVGKQYLAWIGCVLLFIGLFVSAKTYSYSALTINVSASQSLWDYATFWSVILVLLVAASAVLAYVRDYKWLVVTGGVSLLILILNFLYAFSGEVGFSAHPSWGWILLFPGSLLIMVAGAMRSTARDAENVNGLNNIIASVQNRSNSR
jgi:hypothetical protein